MHAHAQYFSLINLYIEFHFVIMPVSPSFKTFNSPCFQEIEGEKFYDEKLRIDLLAVLCRLGHNECNEYSVYLLDEWMSLPNPDEENPIPVSTMCKAKKRGM